MALPLGRSEHVLCTMAAGRLSGQVLGCRLVEHRELRNLGRPPCWLAKFEKLHGIDLLRTLHSPRDALLFAGALTFMVPPQGACTERTTKNTSGATLHEVLPLAGAEMALAADMDGRKQWRASE